MQSCVVLTLLLQQHDESPFQLLFITLCAKLSNAVYCNRSCLFDPHHTGFVGKGSDHLQLIKFWLSCAHGQGVCGGRKILAPPYYSQRTVFASLRVLFYSACFAGDYSRLDWAGQGQPKKNFGDCRSIILQARCPSCRRTNSVKALKG